VRGRARGCACDSRLNVTFIVTNVPTKVTRGKWGANLRKAAHYARRTLGSAGSPVLLRAVDSKIAASGSDREPAAGRCQEAERRRRSRRELACLPVTLGRITPQRRARWLETVRACNDLIGVSP
jgi:hypothetical protein